MPASSAGVTNVHEAKSVLLLVQNEEHVRKTHPFYQGLLPPSVYLRRHRHRSRDKCSQASPLHFCILQVIKNRTVGRPGNEAIWEVLIKHHGQLTVQLCVATIQGWHLFLCTSRSTIYNELLYMHGYLFLCLICILTAGTIQNVS